MKYDLTMYAECIIASGMKIRDALTYQIPENLLKLINVGSIVIVPLKSRRVPAVVSAISNTTSFKEVKNIIDSVDYLPPSTFRLMRFTSQYYLFPLAKVVSTFLPKIPLLSREKGTKPKDESGRGHTVYFEFTYNLKDICQKALSESNFGQVLILCPTLKEAENVSELLGEKSTLLKSASGKKEFFKIWQGFKDGEIKILVSTRIGVFIPSSSLSAVILIEEESSNYKEEASPRYNAADLVYELSSIKKVPVWIYSDSPRMETVSRFHPELPNALPSKTSFNLIKTLPNQIISPDLLSGIKKAVLLHQKVFIYHNRLGKATTLVCSNCNYIFACGRCSTSMVLHKESGREILICHHCNKRSEANSPCPRCGKNSVKQFGFGIQKLEEIIRSELPNVRTSFYLRGQKFEKDSDIIIGTSAIFNSGLSFDLVGMISSDAPFFIPDFRANEKVFRIIQKIKKITSRGGMVLAQYTLDKKDLLNLSVDGNLKDFYQTELAERQKYNLPPAKNLINVRYSHQDPKMVLKNLLDLKTKLVSLGNSVDGPTPGYIPRIRGKVIGSLTIVLEGELDTKTRDLLMTLNTPFAVDRDTLSII